MTASVNNSFTLLRRLLFWSLPVLLLGYILYNIDLAELRRNITQTDPWLLLLGLALFPVSTIAGALRWSALLGPYNRTRIPVWFAIKHYWVGLATGYFTPGTVERLQASNLKSLVLSDTTASALDVTADNIEIVSAARILAQAIWRIHTQQSVGWIFRTLRAEGELPPVEREA